MYDVVDARRLPAQIQDFYYLTALYFSESYVLFMACHVTETMLYICIVYKQYTVKALARLRICASSSESSL